MNIQWSTYKINFEIWGLVLFMAIMLPNFIWFGFPAPNDVLRRESVTPMLDMAAQCFQVLLVAALCAVKNTQAKRPMGRKCKLAVILLVALYYIGWAMYYAGIANAVVILDLCIAPCMAFLVFSAARKNVWAFVFAGAFMVCHTVYGVGNFLL